MIKNVNASWFFYHINARVKFLDEVQIILTVRLVSLLFFLLSNYFQANLKDFTIFNQGPDYGHLL